MEISSTRAGGSSSPSAAVMEGGGRKWEELDPNCLAEIFGRLELRDLLLAIPFVCKPWHRASLDPSCWRRLNFQASYRALVDGFMDTYACERFSFSGLLKLVVARGRGSATHLWLPPSEIFNDEFDKEDLVYLSNEILSGGYWHICIVLGGSILRSRCQRLKYMSHSCKELENEEQISKIIGNWKELEVFVVRYRTMYLKSTLVQIGEHCMNFSCLAMWDLHLTQDTTAAIVQHLLGLKYLILGRLTLERNDLLDILKCCKNLVHLRIKDCKGINNDDDEIMKHAASIKNFVCEGCKVYDSDYEDDYYGISTSDVYDGNSDDGYEL